MSSHDKKGERIKGTTEHPSFPVLNRDDILDLVGHVLFERGLDYYHRGMVEEVSWDGIILRGRVQGVSEPYYQVAIRLTESGWDTDCTCPYDDVVCKHIAAVMLAMLEERGTSEGDDTHGDQKKASRLSEGKVRSFVFGMTKKELADTLWSLALDDADLYRSLALKALTVGGESGNLAEFRRQIHSALSSKDFVEYRQVPQYTRRLEMVAANLKELAQRGCPKEAVKLLENLIDGCAKQLGSLDDSDGIFSGFIRSLFNEWGEFLAQVPDLDHRKLALRVLEYIETDEYGITENIIADLTQTLEKDGIDELETLIRPKYELERSKETTKVKGRYSFNHNLIVYHEALKDIADARGDVDGYIALCEEDEVHASDCLEMACRLKEANRLTEALIMLERGLGFGNSYDSLAISELSKLRIKLLSELERPEDALSAAWDHFKAYPSTNTLALLLAITSTEKRQSTREEALKYVLTQGSVSSAIEICMQEQELSRLAKALCARQEELLKLDYYYLAPLAKELESDFPDLAILIYRKLASDILEAGRSRSYHHAISYLRQVKKLLTAKGRLEEWEKLHEGVKVAHQRKHSFIQLFLKL